LVQIEGKGKIPCDVESAALPHQTAGLVSQASSPEPRTPKSELRPLDSGLRTPDSATLWVGEITEEFHFAPVFADDHTRPTLKVQDGCDARCSFCIIPQVRGPSRSLAPEKVVEQARELERGGYQEIVLSGINLGGYGRDLARRINFLGLLERILAETEIARVRISSIELMDVSAELIRFVALERRMARHFHVPLQSGSDRILRLMNRRYWTSHYAERFRAIHEQIPDCGLGADVMVGFPGETLEDHQASLRLVESLPFTYLHVFPYSARPGTPAAARSDHLNGRVIHERGAEMRALIAMKRRAFLETQIGRTLSALTLDEVREGDRVALSSNYLKVVLPGSEVAANRLLDTRIGRVHDGLLYGYAA
jgi:threonylcarbamoyladenosine tRNA methylthiotransferase MtaB